MQSPRPEPKRLTRGGTKQTEGGSKETSSSPSTKCFPTTGPGTGKRLFLCMSPLVPLDMLHTPNIKVQCKSICRGGEDDGAN